MRVRIIAFSLGLALVAGCQSGVGSSSDETASPTSGLRADAEASTYGDYLSARLAATEHNLAAAAKYYRECLGRDPSNANLLALAFFYSTSAGEVDQAAHLASEVIKKSADDRAARLTVAVANLKSGDFATARVNLEHTAAGPFTNLTSALVEAWASAGQGDSTAALDAIKTISSTSGAEALTTFHLAMLNEYLGHTQDADAAYRAALLKAGPSPRIVEAYGRFLERNGRVKEASALYSKLANDVALAPVIRAREAELASGKRPSPMIVRAQDGAAEALFGIAGSLGDQSSTDIAILYLRLSLYLRPDLALADVLLGDRLESLEKYDDAVAVYAEIPADSPYWQLASIQIALDEAREDKNDKAIADLKALTRQAPSNLDAWTALGDADRNVERWTDASAAYDRAVQILGAPVQKDWPLYYSRAIAEERSHHWDSAETDLRLALKLSPDEPQVLNYLGYSWVDQGRNIPEALRMLEKARQLKPFDGYIVDSVGWAYFKLGRFEDAAKTLEDAILLVPGDPTINDHLGDAFWRVGKKLDARFQWSHALAFGPDSDEKSTLEKKLKDGLPEVQAG